MLTGHDKQATGNREASEVEIQRRKSILQTEKYGVLTTAEHKVLNEGRESRNNH